MTTTAAAAGYQPGDPVTITRTMFAGQIGTILARSDIGLLVRHTIAQRFIADTPNRRTDDARTTLNWFSATSLENA